MRKHIIDKALRRRPGARLKAFSDIERRAAGPMAPIFETLFRRTRRGQGDERLARFLAIDRAG